MRKITTVACALALGLAWALAPAGAQAPPPKAADQADQVEKKAEPKESVGDKMGRAWDKTKAKAKEMNGDVRAVQMALKDKGHDPGAIDGVMGPRTSAAIREFQQKENLTVTGRLDAETRAKLTAAGSSSAPGAPSASPATTDKPGNQQGQKQ